MPDVYGQMQLQDFIEELRAEGFDSFSYDHLRRFVNRGYRHVANKSQWLWALTSTSISVAAGTPYVDLWPTLNGQLPNFRTLDRAYSTAANHRRKLKVSDEDSFFDYIAQDLTSASIRGETDEYRVWRNRLYLIPPPSVDLTFDVWYHQRVSDLEDPEDVPITPKDLDEAILLAARIRAHRRAQEPDLAQEARAELEEMFDNMRDDEEEVMQEEPDRVRPDNTWL
jgi:hypothetical protein